MAKSLYSRGRARRSLIDTVAFRAVSQVATILGYIVMVRGMSREDFGVFNLLYAFIPVLSTVASLGLEQTLRRYQPEYLRGGNTAAAAWLVRFVASTRFGVNVIVLGLILLGWNYAAPLFKLAPYRAEFAVFCFLMLLHFQARVLQLSLASHMLHRFSVGSMAALAVVKLLGYSVLAWQGMLTLGSAIITDTAGFAIAYAMMLLAYRKGCLPLQGAVPFRPDATEKRRLFRYGLYNNFNDAGTLVLNTKSDNFFIAAMIDPLAVGIYAFYTRLNEMVQHLLPVRLFENVVNPLFFASPQAQADDRIPQYFTLLLNLSLALQWPALAYVTAYHGEIVQVLFGGKYGEDSWMLPIVFAFATVNVMAVPVTLVAQYEEKAGTILLSKIFGIYNVVALLVLLPVAGVYGAAIASGSAQAMKNAFIWWHVRRRARWSNVAGALLAGTVVWSGAVTVCYGMKIAFGFSPLPNLLLGGAVMGLAGLLHLRGPAIAVTDRVILGSVLRGREAAILRRIGILPRSDAPKSL